MNDIKFLEKYNEAAIDNFVAVVKQNILFQAQVAYLSEQVAHTDELRKQIIEFEPVKEALVKLRDENINLANELNNKITIIESANKSDAEKYRMQTSLNEQSREIERLSNGLVASQDKVKEQTDYIAKLEEMLPKTAKKKLGITPTIELRQSGSTGNTPSLGVLANGELAINRADGILYYKSSGNTLGSIRTTQPAGLTTEIQFNDAGSFGSNSGFTFSKTTGAVSVSGNVSTAAYFLGDGSKLTGLAPALQIYSLANTASGVSDYMVLKSLDAYTVGTQNTTTKTVTTTPTILTSFVSDVGFPNITSVPSGDIVVEFDTQKSSGAIGYYCYAEIYKRAVGGTETLIATTGNSSSSTLNSQIQQRVNVYISTPVSLVVSDRIVVKIYAVMLSTSASISILFDGAADGALTLPVLPASTVNFVPYINATANVQLNSYSLVANTVTANSIIVLGRDLNAFATPMQHLIQSILA